MLTRTSTPASPPVVVLSRQPERQSLSLLDGAFGPPSPTSPSQVEVALLHILMSTLPVGKRCRPVVGSKSPQAPRGRTSKQAHQKESSVPRIHRSYLPPETERRKHTQPKANSGCLPPGVCLVFISSPPSRPAPGASRCASPSPCPLFREYR